MSPELPVDAMGPAGSERHWSAAQIAEMWGLGPAMIRRLFHEEPGVLVFAKPAKKGRQQHKTLRIPQSVLDRVHRRLQNT